MNELQKSARQKAIKDQTLFAQANKQYGGTLQKYQGDVPRMLLVSHILDVNPTLAETLSADKYYRKGFCRASISEAQAAGISGNKLDDPDTAAYIMGRELNHESISLYTEKKSYFSTPGSDFWKTVYLKHRIGDYGFSQLWGNGEITKNDVYNSLLDSLSNLHRTIIPWSFTELNYLVFFDCEYVNQLASRHGVLQSNNYGKTPVLTSWNVAV